MFFLGFGLWGNELGLRTEGRVHKHHLHDIY